MLRTNARVRPSHRTRAFVVGAWLLVVAPPATLRAAELGLPPGTGTLAATIAASCPACAATGYTPCGSPDVAWGKRFATAALRGTPQRGYLLTFTMTGQDFRALARSTPYDTLLNTLRERFATTRLVVLEEAFKDARVLPNPEHVAVTFPKPLHDCVHGSNRPWACCVSDCHDECCEKSLGSPTIDLHWTDGTEKVAFHYSHMIGVSWLARNTRNTLVRYACLIDEKGKLRSSEAHQTSSAGSAQRAARRAQLQGATD